MDHFPPVHSPCNSVEVPYLDGTYDGGEFTDFPNRQGWNLDRLRPADVEGRTVTDAGRFLQAWLYFGMIHGVLGIEVDVSDFVRIDDRSQKRYITTQHLRAYLRKWRSQIEELQMSGRNDILASRNERAVTCLTYAYNYWFSLEEPERDRFVGPEIGLSIHILASALEHALTSVCDVSVRDVPWRLERNNFLDQRMINFGWCPSILEQIVTVNHLAFQYYASLLFPTSDVKQHEQCHAGDLGCNAKNVSHADLATKHRLPNCDCEFLKVENEAISNIVQEGNIPLLHLGNEGSKTVVKVVPFEKGMHYTALSHVWVF